MKHKQDTVAVVGAGIAGLSFARRFMGHGKSVVLFDKGRSVGGRASSRLIADECGLWADHGAQFFTARDERFKLYVESLRDQGLVSLWQEPIVKILTQNGVSSTLPASLASRFVGTPKMSILPQSLAEGLEIHQSTKINSLQKSPQGWLLIDDAKKTWGPFQKLILTVPPPQIIEFFSPNASNQTVGIQNQTVGIKAFPEVHFGPCWALLVRVPRLRSESLSFGGAFVESDSVLSWMANNSTKPGREAFVKSAHHIWTLHASPEWSLNHLESSLSDVAEFMVGAFSRLVSIEAREISVINKPHRWRYAIPQVVPEKYLYDTDAGLGFCGDWCGGPRVEGAFISGLELAGIILAEG